MKSPHIDLINFLLQQVEAWEPTEDHAGAKEEVRDLLSRKLDFHQNLDIIKEAMVNLGDPGCGELIYKGTEISPVGNVDAEIFAFAETTPDRKTLLTINLTSPIDDAFSANIIILLDMLDEIVTKAHKWQENRQGESK